MNNPISEQYRIAAKDWVQKDAAAKMLEETKTTVLSQMIKQQGDMAYNAAEKEVKASDEWHNFLKNMVNAREAANLAKVKLEYIKMKFYEWQSKEANARSERRL